MFVNPVSRYETVLVDKKLQGPLSPEEHLLDHGRSRDTGGERGWRIKRFLRSYKFTRGYRYRLFMGGHTHLSFAHPILFSSIRIFPKTFQSLFFTLTLLNPPHSQCKGLSPCVRSRKRREREVMMVYDLQRDL